MPPRSTTFQPGTVVNFTYRIEAFIASGGMGEVYRASHILTNSQHAIKVIQAELLSNQRVVQLFQREALALRSIRHDSIVGYEGLNQDEAGRMFLVMEFVEGPSLSEVLRSHGAYSVNDVRKLRDRLATGLAEATWLLLPEHHGVLGPEAARIVVENLKGYASLLVGPGLTQEDETVRFVHELLGIGQRQQSGIGFVTQQPSQTRVGTQTSALKAVPLVLDADALNALARGDNWHEVLPANTILTPHPGEMARLCRCTTADVRADRIGLARSKAAEWNVVVLLKGAYTVVASPDDHATVLPFANPALATAGSGDVLSGVIVGLLSQGLAAYDAAVLGGYLHGLAGELARIDLGEAGVVAGDLIARLPLAIRQLRAA